jgi:hypothetical protein
MTVSTAGAISFFTDIVGAGTFSDAAGNSGVYAQVLSYPLA